MAVRRIVDDPATAAASIASGRRLVGHCGSHPAIHSHEQESIAQNVAWETPNGMRLAPHPTRPSNPEVVGVQRRRGLS